MSYYDSAEGVEITKARAIQELRKHCAGETAEFVAETIRDFLADVGDRATYEATAVLDWLGY